MIHHAFDVTVPKPSSGVDIFFAGDEQEGSPGFRRDVWDEFVADWKRSENPYLIHMGDARNWLRPTMRSKIRAALAGDRSAHAELDVLVEAGLKETLERLKPFKGRIIGMHEGHHDWEFLSGVNCTQLLSHELKALNYGWKAGTRIGINPASWSKENRGGNMQFTIASSHGNASGRDTTSVARSMEVSMKDVVCDLKVQGHACRSASWTPHEYTIIRKRGNAGIVRVLPRHLLVGGFCEAYTNGWESTPKTDLETGRMVGGRPKTTYAEERGLTPQPLMWGVARIRMRYNTALHAERGNTGRAGNPVFDVEIVNRGPSVHGHSVEW